MTTITNRLKRATIAATVVAATGGVAWASVPDGNGTIHACYASKGGAVRIVDGADACTQDETALSWSQAGPQGPAGPAGPATAPAPGSIGSDQLADGAVTAGKIAKGALGKTTAVDDLGFTSEKVVTLHPGGVNHVGTLQPNLATPGSLLFQTAVAIRNPLPHAVLVSVGLLMDGKAEEGAFRQTIPGRSEQTISVPILCNWMPAGDHTAQLTVDLRGGGTGPSPSVRSTTFSALEFRPIFNPPE